MASDGLARSLKNQNQSLSSTKKQCSKNKKIWFTRTKVIVQKPACLQMPMSMMPRITAPYFKFFRLFRI